MFVRQILRVSENSAKKLEVLQTFRVPATHPFPNVSTGTKF